MVELADHVLVGHEHVVEEDVVGDLVAHGLDPLNGDPRMVHGHQEQGDARVLRGVRVGAGPHPVPLGEMRRGGPGLLTVEDPAPLGRSRLQPHGCRVRARLGFAVADSELHLVDENLGQKLLLEELGAMGDQGLANDADALADLGPAPGGQRLVQQVLVDPFSLLATVFGGPRNAQPPLVAQLPHQGPSLGGVDDLGHVLPGEVEHLSVVVGVKKRLDLGGEGPLLGGEVEVHRRWGSGLGRLEPLGGSVPTVTEWLMAQPEHRSGGGLATIMRSPRRPVVRPTGRCRGRVRQ